MRANAGPPLLIGRDDDVAQVEHLIDAARGGIGGSLFFIGEAGAGKTLLLRYAQARAEGLSVLVSQGLEGESGVAYAGLHRLLHPVAHQVEELLDPSDARTLTDAIRLPAGQPAPALTVAAATLRLLQALAARQPVLLTFDNLDWFDPESWSVLAFLVGRVDPAPIALIGAGRDETVALELPDAPTRRLGGLDDAAVSELLATVAAVPAAAAARSALAAGTRGNPRALVELASLLSADQLRGITMLPDPLPVGPATEWAYATPILRLPHATRRVLLLCAAEPDLDAAALSRAAGLFGEDLDALVPAEDAGLVRMDLTGVSFTHPLYRSAAYHACASAGRREAHETIARACPDQAIAHQAAIAREPDEQLAAGLGELADRLRVDRGHAAAAGHMHRAAELSPPSPARSARFYAAANDAWLSGDTGRAVALLDLATVGPLDETAAAKVDLLRAQITMRCGNVVDAYEMLIAAANRFDGCSVELATRALVSAGLSAWFAGDLHRFTQAAQQAQRIVGDHADELPPPVGLGLDFLTGLAAQFAGRLNEAAVPLQRIVDTALRLNDPSSLVLAAACAIVDGDRALVRGLASRALTAARDAGAIAIIPHATEVVARVECWHGRYPFGEPLVLEGLNAARQTGQANYESHLQALLALAAAINGESEQCHERARAADKIARQHSLGLVIATAEWAIAMLDVVHARWAPAYQRLGRLYRAAPGVGHPVVAMSTAPYFVEAAVGAGRPHTGQRVLDIYDQLAVATQRPGRLAIAARCRALLSVGGEVEAHYREALKHHHRSDREFERAYTELLFARHLRRSRQRAEARDLLHSADEVFERLELSLWTKRVRAELRAVGERDDTRPEETDRDRTLRGSGLTAQQLQIARQIASGATNREVAERMFVSPRTVDYHLRNIFQRLSINSRAELIRRFS
jgi:DNA-binding CsgD family transcriptional regulator